MIISHPRLLYFYFFMVSVFYLRVNSWLEGVFFNYTLISCSLNARIWWHKAVLPLPKTISFLNKIYFLGIEAQSEPEKCLTAIVIRCFVMIIGPCPWIGNDNVESQCVSTNYKRWVTTILWLNAVLVAYSLLGPPGTSSYNDDAPQEAMQSAKYKVHANFET